MPGEFEDLFSRIKKERDGTPEMEWPSIRAGSIKFYFQRFGDRTRDLDEVLRSVRAGLKKGSRDDVRTLLTALEKWTDDEVDQKMRTRK